MSGFGSIWIVKESMRLYRPWPGSTRRATPSRRIVCLRCVVRKLGVVPVAIERQPECSSIPMEEHRKKHKPCDQRRYYVAVWISERNMKNNIRHSERCRCPSVVDIGRAEEIAGFPFEFEITVATAFVHSNETGEQLSFAAQWATQPKSSFVTNVHGNACQDSSPVSDCASTCAEESPDNLHVGSRSTTIGFGNLTRLRILEHTGPVRVIMPKQETTI